MKNTNIYNILFDNLLKNIKFLLWYFEVDYEKRLDNKISTTKYIFRLDDACFSWTSTLL